MSDTKQNFADKDTWIRGVLLLVYGIASRFLIWVIWLVAFIQFIIQLFTGAPNDKIQSLSDSFGAFFHSILRFMMYQTEARPFPFSDWPSAESHGKPAAKKSPEKKD